MSGLQWLLWGQCEAVGAGACSVAAAWLIDRRNLRISRYNRDDVVTMYRYKCRCNRNIDLGAIMSKSEYLKLADAIATEIADGTRKPGDRLPPSGILPISAGSPSRRRAVYAELLRRGLVVGEVGRGTFISGEARRGVAAPSEPRGIRIDLSSITRCFPIRPCSSQKVCMASEKPTALEPHCGRRHRWIRRRSAASQRRICRRAHGRLPGSARVHRQRTAEHRGRARRVVPRGGRCGVEPLTYPFIKGIAARLGISLVPLAMDESGVRPDSVQKAHREGHLSALYIQPVIHNSLGMTMSPGASRGSVACRRQARPSGHRGQCLRLPRS